MTHAIDHVLLKARELIADLPVSSNSPSAYNELLSLFFKGLPIAMLGELLRHPNKRIVAGALFIAEELHSKAAPVLGDIIAHVRDEDPHLRIAAYEAIGSCARGENENAFVHVVRGMRDCDASCRKIVLLWMMRVQSTEIEAALHAFESDESDTELQEGLRMLLGRAPGDEASIRNWILDTRALVRMFGLVAAGRVANVYPRLLELAVVSDDSDLRMAAKAAMHLMELRRKWNLKWPL